MRMHTIPQNVSAYEDQIVGSLTGKRFVYLAIGAVAAFVIFSVPAGPAPLRVILAILVAALALALALLRINDRPFDEIFLGYVKAVFGPTEWVWGKENILPAQLSSLIAPTLGPELPPKTGQRKDSAQDKLRQYNYYRTFLSNQVAPDMDVDELNFIEQLDFSQPIPNTIFQSTASAAPAPPMLTPQNYKNTPSPQPSLQPVKLNFTSTNATTPLAGVDADQRIYLAADNIVRHTKRISHDQTRSLSRHALYQELPLPIKGEVTLALTPTPTSTIPSTSPIPTSPVTSVSSDSTTIPIAIPTPPSPPSPFISSPSPSSQTPTPPQSSSTSPQPSQAQSTNAMIESNPQTDMNQYDDSQFNQSHQSDPAAPTYEATFGTPNNRQFFPQDQPNTPLPTPPIPGSDQASTPDQVTYNRPQPQAPSYTHSNKVTESDAQSIDQALNSLQQQAQQLPSTTPPSDQDQLPTSLPLTTVTPQHTHSDYTPLPVNPVLPNNQPAADNLSTPTAAAQSQPQPTPAPTLQTQPQPQPQLQPQPTSPSPIDTHAYQVVNNTPTTAVRQITLTNEPNIINGRVLDAQGQYVPNVIIVVKNDQGEAKRALKTNKLGQFVVTTPLANGTYTVEVDKKDFNFDIIQVQLTGRVLPAIEINAKQ